jgi:hypothetical protein
MINYGLAEIFLKFGIMEFGANSTQPTVWKNKDVLGTHGERPERLILRKGRAIRDGSFSPGESNPGKLAGVCRVLCGLVVGFGFVLIWPKEQCEGRIQ